MKRSLALATLCLTAVACSSPGRWGHARSYANYGDEESKTSAAKELDAPMAVLKPEAWRGQAVRFFMVVDERKPGPGGAAYLTGKLRTRNEVNNCANKYDDDSCRVTIKPVGHDLVHVVVRIAGDDDVGSMRVGSGTLLRVVGTLSDQTDPDDGKLVVQASWYRQWPMGYYVKEGDLLQ